MAGGGRPVLASCLLVGAGLVDVVTAWTHTAGKQFAVVTATGVHEVDITLWAWLHLAIGAAVALAGLLLLTGRRRTVPVALCCAIPAILIDLLLFPYAPIRAVLVVALDGVAFRLLLRHRRAARADNHEISAA